MCVITNVFLCPQFSPAGSQVTPSDEPCVNTTSESLEQCAEQRVNVLSACKWIAI